MKPYFAKYLPVEGEVKDGDYAINSAGSIAQYLVNNDESRKFQKVQLFLCSRDIQVGDTFIDEKGYKYVYDEKDFSEEYFENYKPCKVIGPIEEKVAETLGILIE